VTHYVNQRLRSSTTIRPSYYVRRLIAAHVEEAKQCNRKQQPDVVHGSRDPASRYDDRAVVSFEDGGRH
jgi:hypothetical protein